MGILSVILYSCVLIPLPFFQLVFVYTAIFFTCQNFWVGGMLCAHIRGYYD